MQSEDKKEELQVGPAAGGILTSISDMGSRVISRVAAWIPIAMDKGAQAALQQVHKLITYSVDDKQLRDGAKNFLGRGEIDLGEGKTKITNFDRMESPIPNLYREFKNIKNHENQNNLELETVIDCLDRQRLSINSNSKFNTAMSSIIATMREVQAKCEQYNAAYAKGTEEGILKKSYQEISKLITGANAKIATEVKKYIQQKIDWKADIDKYKFYFAVNLVCSKNDPGMGLCGRAMHAEFARLPLPNTAKRES